MLKSVLLTLVIFVLLTPVIAQRKCATVNLAKEKATYIESKSNFESWIKEKSLKNLKKNALQSQNETTTIYTVPVVVHVIHNGESIGEGTNISYAQIVSQIEVLNEDFRLRNFDISSVPSIFSSLTSDIGFEFKLALQDPSGNSTDGITRSKGSQATWSLSNDTEIKAYDYWPAEDYLNIWIVNIPQGGYIGWSDFPVTNNLNGLEDATNNRLLDGVVVAYDVFGSVLKFPDGKFRRNFDKGRTATHEIGHFFGLRHIWGGINGCTSDDYVIDTPNAESDYQGCPIIGATSTTCGSQDMYMNFMDYVNDECMVMFSEGQKERMLIVINNSPRRKSLLTSKGLSIPNIDLAMSRIAAPTSNICSPTITPAVEVTNLSSDTIQSTTIALLIDNIEVERISYNINLKHMETNTLYFSETTLSKSGDVTFSFVVISVNNATDSNLNNNTISASTFNAELVPEIKESFDIWPSLWSLKTTGEISNWNTSKAHNSMVGNTSGYLNYYDNSSSDTDQLTTQIIAIEAVSDPFLKFSLSYAARLGYSDNLAIAIYTNCSTNNPDIVFNKTGNELATRQNSLVEFYPSSALDWRTILVDLSPYKGQAIQVAFIGTNGGGNNIFVDDIEIIQQATFDPALLGLTNPSGTFHKSIETVDVVLENQGTTTINTIDIGIATESNSGSKTFDNLSLLPGENQILSIPFTLSRNDQNLSVTVLNNDDNVNNNTIESTVLLQLTNESIPYRQYYTNTTIGEEWHTSASVPTSQNWTINSGSATIDATQTIDKGAKQWLITPTLDLSNTTEASMHFKTGYASGNKEESLKIWMSLNGGKSFDELIWEANCSSLSKNTNSLKWQPINDQDWLQQYINLNEFTDYSTVAFAFEFTDNDGGVLFLDEIEFFISDDVTPIMLKEELMGVYPNPVSENLFITFKFEEKEDVQLLMYDIQGHVVLHSELPDVLNQTFPIQIPQLNNGLYIIKAVSKSKSEVKSIILDK